MSSPLPNTLKKEATESRPEVGSSLSSSSAVADKSADAAIAQALSDTHLHEMQAPVAPTSETAVAKGSPRSSRQRYGTESRAASGAISTPPAAPTAAFPGPLAMQGIIIRVPDEHVGRVIGKHGVHIRELQLMTGARVYLPKSGAPGNNYREMLVAGSPEQIGACKELLQNMMRAPGQPPAALHVTPAPYPLPPRPAAPPPPGFPVVMMMMPSPLTAMGAMAPGGYEFGYGGMRPVFHAPGPSPPFVFSYAAGGTTAAGTGLALGGNHSENFGGGFDTPSSPGVPVPVPMPVPVPVPTRPLSMPPGSARSSSAGAGTTAAYGSAGPFAALAPVPMSLSPGSLAFTPLAGGSTVTVPEYLVDNLISSGSFYRIQDESGARLTMSSTVLSGWRVFAFVGIVTHQCGVFLVLCP